jgi:hypothetical protein
VTSSVVSRPNPPLRVVESVNSLTLPPQRGLPPRRPASQTDRLPSGGLAGPPSGFVAGRPPARGPVHPPLSRSGLAAQSRLAEGTVGRDQAGTRTWDAVRVRPSPAQGQTG